MNTSILSEKINQAPECTIQVHHNQRRGLPVFLQPVSIVLELLNLLETQAICQKKTNQAPECLVYTPQHSDNKTDVTSTSGLLVHVR